MALRIVMPIRLLLQVAMMNQSRSAGFLQRASAFMGAIIFLLLLHMSCAAADARERCGRIVSLAPSITEVLFDLNLEDRIVGVTRYCQYPEAAQALPRIGGILDFNLEKIIRRKPKTVVALSESFIQSEVLHRVGIGVLRVDHRSVNGIKESYRTLGQECAVEEFAEKRVQQLETIERQIARRCAIGDKPLTKFMFVVGHIPGGDGIYLSGGDGFYSDLARVLGGENVHNSRTIAVPSVSKEGIIALNPDVIIEVVDPSAKVADGELLGFWQRFNSLEAVKRKRVIILRDDYASIPGPRYIKLLQTLSTVLCER